MGKKRVVIPISAVTGAADRVRLRFTRDQIRDLPPIDLAEPDLPPLRPVRGQNLRN
jgi:hypothetical protein